MKHTINLGAHVKVGDQEGYVIGRTFGNPTTYDVKLFDSDTLLCRSEMTIINLIPSDERIPKGIRELFSMQ